MVSSWRILSKRRLWCYIGKIRNGNEEIFEVRMSTDWVQWANMELRQRIYMIKLTSSITLIFSVVWCFCYQRFWFYEWRELREDNECFWTWYLLYWYNTTLYTRSFDFRKASNAHLHSNDRNQVPAILHSHLVIVIILSHWKSSGEPFSKE